MNFLQLPEDILIKIIDEMNDNIFHVSIVNKEIYTLSNDRLRREREKIERRVAFFERFYRGDGIGPTIFYWNAFHGVITIEECNFLYERYTKDYDSRTFMSRVRYTIGNTYQIAAETWTQYLQIHDPPGQKLVES